jgi:integrase/recombinase XerD
MVARRAKTLTDDQLTRYIGWLATAADSPYKAARTITTTLLSFRAGLRVGEIAGLSWKDVTDAEGRLRSDTLSVPANVAKKGHHREIPMHPEIHSALGLLMELSDVRCLRARDPIIRAQKGGRIKPNTLTVEVNDRFRRFGFQGVTSHSGRRAFITRAIRAAPLHGCSLMDVQGAAGHRYVNTTQLYVEPSAGLASLINSL